MEAPALQRLQVVAEWKECKIEPISLAKIKELKNFCSFETNPFRLERSRVK
jgi:hypothetical protein